MYRYHIAFSHAPRPGALQTSSFQYADSRPITGDADIDRITQHLTRRGYREAFILAFSLFTDPAPNPKAAS